MGRRGRLAVAALQVGAEGGGAGWAQAAAAGGFPPPPGPGRRGLLLMVPGCLRRGGGFGAPLVRGARSAYNAMGFTEKKLKRGKAVVAA